MVPTVRLLVVSALLRTVSGSCGPPLHVDDEPHGGGRTVQVSLPPPPCRCKFLRLDVSDSIDKPSPGNGRWEKMEVWSAENIANVTTTAFLAGWYRTLCCRGRYSCKFSDGVGEPRWMTGINVTTWNVSVSPVQTAGAPRLSINLIQWDPSAPPGFFFPRLKLDTFGPRRFHVCEDITFHNNSWQKCVISGQNDSDLVPGQYSISIRPADGVITRCHGYSDGCPLLATEHQIVSVPLRNAPPLGTERTNAWPYAAAAGGVSLAAAAAVITALLRRRTGTLLKNRIVVQSQPSCLQASCPSQPSDPVASRHRTVLLLHRGVVTTSVQSALLHTLTASMRAAGLSVLNLHESQLQRLLLTVPSPAELLSREPLRSARLLFVATGAELDLDVGPQDGTSDKHCNGNVCGGDSGSDSGSASGATTVANRMYDMLLRYVRNDRHGLDYGRVFAARLGAASAAELLGLTVGRLFTVPGDEQVLVEHLSASGENTVRDTPMTSTVWVHDNGTVQNELIDTV